MIDKSSNESKEPADIPSNSSAEGILEIEHISTNERLTDALKKHVGILCRALPVGTRYITTALLSIKFC